MKVKANILQKILQGTTKLSTKLEELTPTDVQKKVLRKLLKTAKDTDFGSKFRFKLMLVSEDAIGLFQRFVPIYDYNKMYDDWWCRTHQGDENVTWPGIISKFALSSGTSGSTSKHIPISKMMLRKINRVSLRQMQILDEFDLSVDFFDSSILGVGGSTSLIRDGHKLEGDLSGIINGNIPSLLTKVYKPEREITAITDWSVKIEKMVEKAPEWNIGLIVGIPSWIQILLEKIIAKYELKNIHELWPHFSVLVHGGVAFDPYKKNFEKLLGKPIEYMETYLTSEGFLGYSYGRGRPIQLVLNRGVFFEFIPFTPNNFTSNGELVSFPDVYTVYEVESDVNYAIVISTCAGTWRYLLGDTIKFLNVERAEIIITGRTKHYLTICGEHLSVDNMNQALKIVCDDMNITIPEFCVKAFAYENLFAHQWYIGSDDEFDKTVFGEKLDKALCDLNDDYKTERTSALKEIFIEQLPVHCFYDFLSSTGKVGAQVKFPRVVKDDFLNEWEIYIAKL